MKVFLVLILSFILIAVSLLRQAHRGEVENNQVFATNVLGQYIRYYCPHSGLCTRKKALIRMKTNWPHIYRLGFQELREEN